MVPPGTFPPLDTLANPLLLTFFFFLPWYFFCLFTTLLPLKFPRCFFQSPTFQWVCLFFFFFLGWVVDIIFSSSNTFSPLSPVLDFPLGNAPFSLGVPLPLGGLGRRGGGDASIFFVGQPFFPPPPNFRRGDCAVILANPCFHW